MPMKEPRSSRAVLLGLWHFSCPACGFGDDETGHPVTVDIIHCEVCLEDGQCVRLRRWPVEQPAPKAASRPAPRPRPR